MNYKIVVAASLLLSAVLSTIGFIIHSRKTK